MNKTPIILLEAISKDDIKTFESKIRSSPQLLNSRSDNLNLYQIAAICRSVNIMKYFDSKGFGQLSNEIDEVSFIIFYQKNSILEINEVFF